MEYGVEKGEERKGNEGNEENGVKRIAMSRGKMKELGMSSEERTVSNEQ